MRNDRLVPGIILITLGAIFLLRSFGYIHIHWTNIIHLWPIFLLIAGINLIFAHNRTAWATILKVAVVIAGICILLFANFNNNFNIWPHYYYHYDSSDNDNDDDGDGHNIVKVEGTTTFNEPFHPEVKIGKLNISGGGTVYRLSDTTNQLFQADVKEWGQRYEYNHHSEDSVYVIDFNMKKNSHFNWNNNHANSATFRLNSAPIWDIDVQTGATKLDFDLSKFKLRNLKISGGAASFAVKLGEPLTATRLDISTGVSEVKINIPRDAACHIETDSGLSSNNFDGFNSTGDNNYETPGFNAAANKIYINISGGISDFKVNRY